MNNVLLPDLISSKIKSYEEIYLVKTDHENDGVFDQYHLKEMLKFLEKLLDSVDNIKVKKNSPYECFDRMSIKCDEIPSHLIKFISGNDKHLYFSGEYPETNEIYHRIEYLNTDLVTITITIKKIYLNIHTFNIKSYEEIYLVKTNNDNDRVFDKYHLKEIFKIIEENNKLLKIGDYMSVTVINGIYNRINERIKCCDEIPSHLIKFISGNDKCLKIFGSTQHGRLIKITIKKMYLNIPLYLNIPTW
jgi:hypothetical protein